MLHEEGDPDAWSAVLASVPPTAESESQVWKSRGLLRERDGDWAGAAQAYREALARDPYVTAYHYRLAMVEDRLGHRDMAAEHRRKADRLASEVCCCRPTPTSSMPRSIGLRTPRTCRLR